MTRHGDLVLRLVFAACLALGLGLGAHAAWRIASGTGLAPDPLADWMTPAHVEAVFGIPPGRVAAELGLAGPLPALPLRDLAQAQGMDPAALVAALQPAAR